MKQTSDTHNRNKLKIHYAEGKVLYLKKSTCLITFYVVREWTKLTYSERNQNSGCLWWVVWMDSEGALGIFLGWWKCSILDRVMGYTSLYVKIPWNERVAWCTHAITDPLAQLVGGVGTAPPATKGSSLNFSESYTRALCRSMTKCPRLLQITQVIKVSAVVKRLTYAGSGDSAGTKVLPP